MLSRCAVLLACLAALAGCAQPAPQPEPRPITDQTMGGKFGTAPAGTVVYGTPLPSDSPDFRSNLMRETGMVTSYGCVPRAGVMQRGTLICPGQGG